MSQLRIYLASDWRDVSSACTWALLDETGELSQTGTGNLASMPRAHECIAIVAAAQVLCVSQTLPKIKSSQMETALPLLLEEFMLGEPADHHVIPGKVLADGKHVLYAVDKAWLRQFVDACAQSNMRLRRVLPEYALMTVRNGEWSLVWDGSSGLLALSHHQGLMLGQGNTQQMPAGLALQLSSVQTAPLLRVFFPVQMSGEQKILPVWHGVSLIAAELPFDWRTAPLAADMPNLLWGKFAAPIRMQEWWPKLRPAVWVIALFLGIEALGYNLQWGLLAHEQQQIKRSMNSVFQETFGSEVEVVDAPLQLRRSLARQRHIAGIADDADFLPLLERVSTELSVQPGSQLTGLRYATGQLEIEARLPSRLVLETLQQRLTELGLLSQSLDVKESGSGIEAHMRIRSGGAR